MLLIKPYVFVDHKLFYPYLSCMVRKELIKYIKEHDSRYADFDFNKNEYSSALLEVIKKRIDRGKDRKKPDKASPKK